MAGNPFNPGKWERQMLQKMKALKKPFIFILIIIGLFTGILAIIYTFELFISLIANLFKRKN